MPVRIALRYTFHIARILEAVPENKEALRLAKRAIAKLPEVG